MSGTRARALPSRWRAAFAARALDKPLRSMQRESDGVRQNEDIECVHRMRVASRRLRNAFDLFADELPAAARRPWQKRLQGVTKALGAARDLDVQLAFLQEYMNARIGARAKDRPGLEHVRATLTARRAAAQQDVLKALDRLKASDVLRGLAGWVQKHRRGRDGRIACADKLRVEAGRAVRQRLGALLAYAPYVEEPKAAKELHALRIAAKHLRYTLEAYAPLYADALKAQIQWGRQLQDWLGEIHDCDVWQEELGALLQGLDQPRARLAAGIQHLRHERSERRQAVYEEFRAAWRNAAATGYWDEFRAPFAVDPAESVVLGTADDCHGQDGFGSDSRLQPVFELARACRYERAHTHQVTRLARRLFEQLAKLHGLDDERRFWLTCASLLHDIGWIEGRAGHHKAALRLILESPRLPWDERQRRMVGLVARYHRKALPSESHAHFRALSAADQADVRKLAAILRLADALDYSHACVVADVACRVTAKRISLRCATKRSADVECVRATEKGDLAAQVFGREINVTWRLR
jgi:CHAD domain-containing protein